MMDYNSSNCKDVYAFGLDVLLYLEWLPIPVLHCRQRYRTEQRIGLRGWRQIRAGWREG